MKKFFTFLCAVTLVLGLVSSVSALTISFQYGDQDGMGINGLTAGDTFDFHNVSADSNDAGTITDTWMHGNQTWTQQYDITGLGAITAASFEIATGGQGWRGLTKLYIDGVYAGTLTDGDYYSGGSSLNNHYQIDTFDLINIGIPLTGSILTLQTDHYYSSGDGWALDYSLLTLSGDNTAPVPEPSTILLMGIGLLGLVGYSRKRSKKS